MAMTMAAAAIPPMDMPTMAGVWSDDDFVTAGRLVGEEVADEVRGGSVVGVARMGFSVVVMNWVTGSWFVIVMMDVTSIVVLALRTLWGLSAVLRWHSVLG